ncbi:MAG: hypothetical protein DME06_04425, partial [Candidatus Rokuibacteriota bacterium]
MSGRLSRRDFLAGAGTAGVALLLSPPRASAGAADPVLAG